MSNFFYDKDCPLIPLPLNTSRKIKAHNEEVMIVEVFFDKGGVGTVHTHEHTQATYCLEGEFEFTVGDEKKIIKPGDTIVMPSNIEHGCRVLTESGRLLDIFTPERKDFL